MTQSPHVVARVGALLRVLSSHEPRGATTTQVGVEAALPRATAHRLLSSMATEGLVDRDPDTSRWLLGPEMYLAGMAVARRHDIVELARPVVSKLAIVTGESAFFSVRRGDEAVCLVREDGSFPLRSHVLSEGVRFPLGVASAGLAILAHLPDREVDEYLERADLSPWPGHEREALTQRITQARENGYAVNPGLIVEGSWGIGAAVFDSVGRPAWALSLTGVESRFRSERHPDMGRALLNAAHALARSMATTSWSSRVPNQGASKR